MSLGNDYGGDGIGVADGAVSMASASRSPAKISGVMYMCLATVLFIRTQEAVHPLATCLKVVLITCSSHVDK